MQAPKADQWRGLALPNMKMHHGASKLKYCGYDLWTDRLKEYNRNPGNRLSWIWLFLNAGKHYNMESWEYYNVEVKSALLISTQKTEQGPVE